MSSFATKTPFYAATDHHPARIGPYECVSTATKAIMATMGRDEDNSAVQKHYRWWDGTQWSFPLDYDPDLDLGAQEPGVQHYPDPHYYSIETIQASFAWRGFTEDQDEL